MKNDIKNVILERLKALSDTQLLDALRSAVQAERQSTAALVAHIAEVDARRLYLERAKPSMFSYCVDVLKLSEQAAYLRIHAARLTRRFPEALDGLATGTLHLTALKLVGPHLTEENSEAVLERVSGKSRRAIEQELARLFPREDAPSQLRKLPARRGHDCAVRARERTRSESRYRLQVTLPEQTRVKLDAARDLLRHQVPDGDLASVLDCALDALIEARMKRKFAKTSRPRHEASSSKPNQSRTGRRHGRPNPLTRRGRPLSLSLRLGRASPQPLHQHRAAATQNHDPAARYRAPAIPNNLLLNARPTRAFARVPVTFQTPSSARWLSAMGCVAASSMRRAVAARPRANSSFIITTPSQKAVLT